MAQTQYLARRRWLVVAVAVIVVLLVVLGILSSFYVDILWFREVHYSGVFWRVLWTKLVLGSASGVFFFLLMAGNLMIVRRTTPRFRVFSPEREIIERYRTAVEPYARLIIPILSAVVALFVGIATSGQWQTLLLWRAASASTTFQSVLHTSAVLDPVFHRDPSFYIFILPFQQLMQGWLFSALVGVTVVSALAHYFTGGIRTQGEERVTPQVKAHLSVLIGLIVLVKAWGYYLGQYTLLTSNRGVVTGASYTDLHAQLPALRLLVFIAIACALLFLVNIRFRGWALPVLGIGLLFVASIVVGAIVPAAVQKFSVAPQEFQREEPYILRNIAATRFAFGLNKVQTQANPTLGPTVTAADVSANQPTVQNIRLWNPLILQDAYNQVQRFQPYYLFNDVDVDRYQVNQVEKMVMISVREISQNGIVGQRTWQNVHLTFTHGYGAVASLVTGVGASGGPDFLLQNIPSSTDAQKLQLSSRGAQVYYGERSDVPYVLVDTKQQELNYPNTGGSGFTPTTYRGSGGIPVGSLFRRLVFAYRYRDFNLLISGLVTPQTKILIRRDIRTRVQTIAPFLKYDGDPYAIVAGRQVYFVWDAYTSTTRYPYSEELNLGGVSALRGTANYIRNSVKVVVNAYTGAVRFYVVDQQDPLIRVWERAFPDLFTTTPPPAAIAAHFRYPEGLLAVQSAEFARYHVTDAAAFYQNSRLWAVANALPVGVDTTASGPMAPYYVLMKLPDDTVEHFVLFEPFTPAGRQNMVAYLAGGSDGYGQSGGQYGKLTLVQFPGGENITGPSQARSYINQDPATSAQISLLSKSGSRVEFGDMIIVPVGNSFLYVQPIFLVAAGTNAIPELKLVTVVNGQNVSLSNTLAGAIRAAVGQAPPPSGGGGPPAGATVAQLLTEAVAHFQAAEADLKKGDLAGYAEEIAKAQALVAQAQKLAAKASPTPSTSPTPSVSPSASPSG